MILFTLLIFKFVVVFNFWDKDVLLKLKPNFNHFNGVFEDQIKRKEIYCDLNVLIHRSFSDNFVSSYHAKLYINKTLEKVNQFLKANLIWEGSYEMMRYHIKSISILHESHFLNQYIDDPNDLLVNLNDYVLSRQNYHCQHVIFTAAYWKDILGVSFVHEPKEDTYPLCNSASSFVMTANIDKRFINIPTLAYLFIHEATHTLDADHIQENQKLRINKIEKSIFKNLSTMNFIMDSSTGIIGDSFTPEFGKETLDVIMQTLFLKGKGCFKSLIPKTCGDEILTLDEQCDSSDYCCNQAGNEFECLMHNDAKCLSIEPCCNMYCQFKTSQQKCHGVDECSANQTCSGTDSKCPVINSGETCSYGICLNGICDGNYCLQIKSTSCKITSDQCILSCVKSDGTCGYIYKNDNAIKLDDGTLCGKDNLGFCQNGLCMHLFGKDLNEPTKNKRPQPIHIFYIGICGLFVIIIILLTIILLLRIRRGRVIIV